MWFVVADLRFGFVGLVVAILLVYFGMLFGRWAWRGWWVLRLGGVWDVLGGCIVLRLLVNSVVYLLIFTCGCCVCLTTLVFVMVGYSLLFSVA